MQALQGSFRLSALMGCRWFAALAVLPTWLAWGGAAQAAADEEEASPPAEASAPPPAKAEPIAAKVVPVVEAPAPPAPAPVIEQMGPETFPGRLRGLYGGSLWLEPSFHGLQWPQNTRTGIGLSGSFWVDSGNERITRDRPQLPNSKMYFQQGRGLLRVTPAYVSGPLFVQGQVELVGNLCQAATSGPAANPVTNTVCQSAGTFSTDDLWIRVGQWNLWDVKVGRFEAWEVYHLGMGMEPYTLERLGAGMLGVDSTTTPRLEAPTLYAVNYLHDRPTEGLAVGYAAAHAYVTPYLRFELLAKLGDDNNRADNGTGDTPSTYYGARPTAIFDIGWLKLKAAGEYQKRSAVVQTVDGGGNKHDNTDNRTQEGVGGSAQFVIDPFVEFGVNAALGKTRHVNSYGTEVGEDSYTTKSIGLFANGRFAEGWLGGLGVNWTTQLDKFLASGSTSNDYTTHFQAFAALQYLLARQLYIKAVFGYARAGFQASDVTVPVWNNYMYSGRVRLMYLY